MHRVLFTWQSRRRSWVEPASPRAYKAHREHPEMSGHPEIAVLVIGVKAVRK